MMLSIFRSTCLPHLLLLVVTSMRADDAARDIVHINISSLWFLSNILRQIATGWAFQLSADAFFGFCCNAVNMIGFELNTVRNHNHPLCLSIIPHQTEGELTYICLFMQEAFILLYSIRTCTRVNCYTCVRLKKLFENERVITYLNCDTFKDGKISVHLGMW